MFKDDAYILDMVLAAKKALRYVGLADYPSFEANAMLQDAVMLQLMVHGEAGNKLSSEFRESHPEIPWAKIRATRNVIAHEYLDVKLDKI